jgi:penicillin-insensitive murein endopeptidase
MKPTWIVAFTLVVAALPALALDNPWTRIKAPAEGRPESIGSPSAGCLRGAAALTTESVQGYILMRPSRGRNFGHPRLVTLIEEIAKERASRKQAPLLIGDLGLPRGGPTMSAHSSHQTGLDADIWYHQHRQWKGRKTVSIRDRERLYAPGMVDKKRLAVTRAFGNDQRELLRSFAISPEVDRILVHFAIKRELCQRMPREPWIRKIRPWFGHDHHFHVRLACSPSDPLCRKGDPIPEGNGCDDTLDWWWSDEARAEATKNLDRQEHPVMPNLPVECAPLSVDAGTQRF